MKNKETFSNISAGVSAMFAMVSISDVETIISIIGGAVAILAGIISLIYTLTKWYQRATSVDSLSGKKVTLDELLEGIDIVKEETEKIKEVIDKINKEDE